MKEVEVYFVFKFDEQDREMILTRDRLHKPSYFAYDKENIAIMSEKEANDLAHEHNAGVGSMTALLKD